MSGKTAERGRAPSCVRKAKARKTSQRLLPHKVFDGNRPTNSILFRSSPRRRSAAWSPCTSTRSSSRASIWNIYSFDQWGVELGKQLASRILPELRDDAPVTGHDASTNGLITAYKEMRQRA